jgi:hypothetical protein
MHRKTVVLLLGWALAWTACGKHHRAVTTYHYENLRTGWNSEEERLTPAKVSSSKFGVLETVALDDQVDAQPLLVPDVKVTAGAHQGEHEVVYVATEGNTIYAIDAASGMVLLSPNFGPPVPSPLGCTNNGPNVGINGTPVIDREHGTMYVVTYTNEASGPIYRIHALDLGSLKDKIPSVVVAASHTLTNGTTFTFNAQYQRQRPALLASHGNVYAGFGSFCDFRADVSRGWVLGWQIGTLTALAANQMNDRLASSPSTFFLSSVWMSGYGLSADPEGHLYFVTGNSDSNSYTGTTNIQESVVKISPDLTGLLDVFTPFDVNSLDSADNDYGSGGALLLALQPGPKPRLAAAAGKNGNLYLLDRDKLGGFTAGGPDKVVGIVNIGGCWCGQSYFSAKGVGHIVSSGGNNVIVWRVQTSPSVSLLNEASSPALATGQDPGFFTSVSSDDSENAIIWAISRPENSSPANVSLYAFAAQPPAGSTGLALLFQGVAGAWPNTNGNANIVPMVANGQVYVASNKQLTIFGLH